MTRQNKPLHSSLGRSRADSVQVRGLDLPNELMGHINFGDMAFLQITGRKPEQPESVVFNAMLVALAEHGMTPSAIATRLTLAGSPEALQGAIAAGLCGVGSRFAGTMEGAARVLSSTLANAAGDADDASLARAVVADHRERRAFVPGVGHPVHKPLDPRAERLRVLAGENGLAGRHVALMWAISKEASERYGRELPVNVTGAIGALLCELDIDWRVARGIAVISRAVGLVGHAFEEMNSPMAYEIYERVEEEVGSR